MTENTLLTLPLELRNIIYAYVFTTPTGYICLRDISQNKLQAKPPYNFFPYQHTSDYHTSSPTCETKVSTPLSQTCRQIHDESRDFPYICNTLAFHTAWDIDFPLSRIPTENPCRVRHIWFSIDLLQPGHRGPLEYSLQRFHNWKVDGGDLRTVTINIENATLSIVYSRSEYSNYPRILEVFRKSRDATLFPGWKRVRKRLEIRFKGMTLHCNPLHDPNDTLRELCEAWQGGFGSMVCYALRMVRRLYDRLSGVEIRIKVLSCLREVYGLWIRIRGPSSNINCNG